MIGKLTGTVDFVGEDHVLIDVAGVGYLVHCPSSTLSKLRAFSGTLAAMWSNTSSPVNCLPFPYGALNALEAKVR